MWETWVWSWGWENPLEKGKAPHSSILAWRILWTVKSMGPQRIGHDWVTWTCTFTVDLGQGQRDILGGKRGREPEMEVRDGGSKRSKAQEGFDMPLLAWRLGMPQGRGCGQSPGVKSGPQLKTEKEMRPTQSFKCKELNSAKENKSGFWIVNSFLSASRKELSLISARWNHEQRSQQYYIGLLNYKTENS